MLDWVARAVFAAERARSPVAELLEAEPELAELRRQTGARLVGRADGRAKDRRRRRRGRQGRLGELGLMPGTPPVALAPSSVAHPMPANPSPLLAGLIADGGAYDCVPVLAEFERRAEMVDAIRAFIPRCHPANRAGWERLAEAGESRMAVLLARLCALSAGGA